MERHGRGAPIVLVHGWGADSQSNWRDTGWVDDLCQFRDVVCLDVRGHGNSDKPYANAPYSYTALSSDVLAVMDALDIPQADYLGYSMGAFMGAYLLGHHHERFRAMVLGGIGDETPESAAIGAIAAQALRRQDDSAEDTPLQRGYRQFASANPRNDLQALAYSAEQMWPEGYPLKLYGHPETVPACRVLVINGEDDHPYVDTADQFVAALPNAEHVRIAGVNHLTAVSSRRFRQAVINFLKS